MPEKPLNSKQGSNVTNIFDIKRLSAFTSKKSIQQANKFSGKKAMSIHRSLDIHFQNIP